MKIEFTEFERQSVDTVLSARIQETARQVAGLENLKKEQAAYVQLRKSLDEDLNKEELTTLSKLVGRMAVRVAAGIWNKLPAEYRT